MPFVERHGLGRLLIISASYAATCRRGNLLVYSFDTPQRGGYSEQVFTGDMNMNVVIARVINNAGVRLIGAWPVNQ